MSEQDVDQFLWELEQKLSHLNGQDRRALILEAEGLLHEAAARIARSQGDEDLDWYHYVQATAELGPPERLAAELTGEPLPDQERTHTKLWILAGVSVALILAVLVGAWLSHGELEPVGTWSGQESDLTGQRVLTFNVSENATSVFLNTVIIPVQGEGAVRLTVLDGEANLVYDDVATLQDHIETAQYLEGGAGTWRVLLDFEGFTGNWRVDARQELP
ncbi:MAG: hypothetical protein R3185_08290 [Candidatus Thermoplasmatota archaeon]|nr:hypothetical protein [Candidatus Thermoplasmatota archaeon]